MNRDNLVLVISIGSLLFLFASCINKANAQTVPLIPPSVDINMGTGTQAASQSWSWSNSNSNATGGDATATGGAANNMGNNQNVNFQTGDGVHQAPSVLMGSLFPTAPCQGTANGFLSAFVFGGVGGGASFTLAQCEIREEARVAAGIGQMEMAKAILCMAKYAKKTEQCREYQIEED